MHSGETKCVRIFNIGWHYDLSQLSDAKIRTDDGCTFDVHRVILARNRDYFRAMICGTGKERRDFRIPGISGECLSDILSYVYTEDVRVTERNLRDLMIGADYLLLNDLQMEIKQSTKANTTEANCLRILHAAYQISDEGIFQECFRFVQTRFEGIMRCQNNDLADLPEDILILILGNRSLYVYDETTVWRAIVEWTQKDIPFRMRSVPQLLLTLAVEDVGEKLATEILQHEIISKNSLMKDVVETKSSNDFTSGLDALLSFLCSCSNRFIERHSHRIPLKLHVISSHTRGMRRHAVGNSNNLYITYDENPDLWRKMTGVNFQPDFLISIGYNVYIFEMVEGICMNFDLRTMDWVTMESYRYAYRDYCVVAIDAYIYVLGEINDHWGSMTVLDYINRTYNVQVFDTVNNRWFDGVSLGNICHCVAVAIENKIYVVGNTRRFDGMVAQMFDTITQNWSRLSPPTVYHYKFVLVTYHQKMYLVGDSPREEDISSAEVFDPATNHWRELPDLPYVYSWPNAVVFNDQFIVYDDGYEDTDNTKNVRWNDGMECWGKLGETDTLKDLNLHRFCTIDDVETIRMITKRNRDPQTQMEKSFFN